MSCRGILLLVSILLAFSPGQDLPALAGPITVLTPKATCTILARDPGTTLVLKISDQKDLDKLKINVGATTLKPFGKWGKGGVFYPHFRLPLKPGKNVYEIVPWYKVLKINYRPLRSLLHVKMDDPAVFMFHRTGIVPKGCVQCHTETIPQDVNISAALYGPFDPRCISCHKKLVTNSKWQHGPAANWLCMYCHEADNNTKGITIFSGKPVDLCLKCHVRGRKWLKMSHVHGPVGTGDCTACHNPHGNKYEFQLWANGNGDLCVACHTDKKKYLEETSAFYVHGILTGKGCTICHSPHATEYRFQLYKPINKLCEGCHTMLKGITRGHPVGGHPVTGPKDPKRKGRKFSCTSCHNPHGSEYRFLLIGDILGGHVCSKCHY